MHIKTDGMIYFEYGRLAGLGTCGVFVLTNILFILRLWYWQLITFTYFAVVSYVLTWAGLIIIFHRYLIGNRPYGCLSASAIGLVKIYKSITIRLTPII